MKLARLKYTIVVTITLSLSLGILVYFKTGKSAAAWFTGIFLFVFLCPLIYFRMSRSIKVGKFNYDLKDGNRVLYSAVVNYYDDVLYYGRSLFPTTINTSMGGRLYLLKDKLVFQTNFLNYSSRREVVILVKDIYCVGIESDCPFKKAFFIETDQNKYNFFSGDREELKVQILRQKALLA